MEVLRFNFGGLSPSFHPTSTAWGLTDEIPCFGAFAMPFSVERGLGNRTNIGAEGGTEQVPFHGRTPIREEHRRGSGLGGRRPQRVPIGRLLVPLGKSQENGFLEWAPDELQPDRQAVA